MERLPIAWRWRWRWRWSAVGFADNLSKQLPRIPPVKNEADFWAFSKAGRTLGDLHVNYETVVPHAVTIVEGDLRLAHIADPKSYYRVEQMRFAGTRPNLDKTTVVYNNNNITICVVGELIR